MLKLTHKNFHVKINHRNPSEKNHLDTPKINFRPRHSLRTFSRKHYPRTISRRSQLSVNAHGLLVTALHLHGLQHVSEDLYVADDGNEDEEERKKERKRRKEAITTQYRVVVIRRRTC